MSLATGLMGAPMVFGRLMNILMDQQVVDDTGAIQGDRTFVLHTSALTPQIAKAKVRIFTLGLRPKRKIVDIEIGILEEGIFLKRYQLTVKTELIKRKQEDGEHE